MANETKASVIVQTQPYNGLARGRSKDDDAFEIERLDIFKQPVGTMATSLCGGRIIPRLCVALLRSLARETLDRVRDVVMLATLPSELESRRHSRSGGVGFSAYHRAPLSPFLDTGRLKDEEHGGPVIFHRERRVTNLPILLGQMRPTVVRAVFAVTVVEGGHSESLICFAACVPVTPHRTRGDAALNDGALLEGRRIRHGRKKRLVV